MGDTVKNPKIATWFVSGNEVQEDCVDWALDISHDFVPDLIVFLANSGFLFAKPMAACFGCEMVDIKVSRSTNKSKDAFAKIIPWLPNSVLAAALKSKAVYGIHDKTSERSLQLTERFKSLDFAKYEDILVVDDSIDTGWSMIEAVEAVRQAAPASDIRVASYCVISASESRIKADYLRYRDTIVVTATSRYSEEHSGFLSDYALWMENGQ